MDRIILQKMQFYGYHGVLPEENKLGQLFYVDLELVMDLKPSGHSDDLSQTVNYADAYALVQEIVEEETYQLVEAVAERIAAKILSEYVRVEEVKVRVHKPNPPFRVFFEQVTVEIQRGRN